MGQRKDPVVLIEAWRKCWREGFQPDLTTFQLEALYEALEKDDKALLQGTTTTPPPLLCVQDWPMKGACAIAYTGWKGLDLHTVAEVEEYFARACHLADQRLGEPGACRYFLNWHDETPRNEMRNALLAEIKWELFRRKENVNADLACN
jgi:hypothetical protein